MFLYKSHRPTWAEVDMDAIQKNLIAVQKRCGETGKIMGVVKADAYGHGAVTISKELLRFGVEYLAVSNLDEAIELRSSGISSPLLMFGPVETAEFGKLMEFNIYPTVTSTDYAKELVSSYRYRGIYPKIHIKVDTGMGRLGIPIDDALIEIEQISKLQGVIIDGIYTHFPSAENDLEFSKYQIDRFSKLIAEIKRIDIKCHYFHMANSAGLFNLPESMQGYFNMARPGLSLYGCSYNKNKELRNVMALKTRIAVIRKLKKDDTVSYQRTYTVKNDEEFIAVLPVGYADGIPTNYSNRGKVWIKDNYYPVAGRVCMDYIMVSLGKNPKGILAGDEVIIFGGGKIPIEDFAKACGRIPYEVMCDVSKRVPRIYLRSEDKRAGEYC